MFFEAVLGNPEDYGMFEPIPPPPFYDDAQGAELQASRTTSGARWKSGEQVIEANEKTRMKSAPQIATSVIKVEG